MYLFFVIFIYILYESLGFIYLIILANINLKTRGGTNPVAQENLLNSRYSLKLFNICLMKSFYFFQGLLLPYFEVFIHGFEH